MMMFLLKKQIVIVGHLLQPSGRRLLLHVRERNPIYSSIIFGIKSIIISMKADLIGSGVSVTQPGVAQGERGPPAEIPQPERAHR